MRNPASAQAAIALALLSAGCSGTSEFQQTVHVMIARDGAPISGLPVRYYTDANCTGGYEEQFTSEAGTAEITRVALKGTFAVVLEHPSVCFISDGEWYSAWQEYIDPMPLETFSCAAVGDGNFSCKAVAG